MSTLFVVDDDPRVVRTLRRSVPSGLEVRSALSAAAARELLDERRDWAGFVVDARLGTDATAGIELLREIRARWPTRPAILLTGSREPSILNAASALNALVFMKPAGPDELAAFFARTREPAARQVVLDALSRTPLAGRERDVVVAHFDGLSTAQTATRLGLSERTVETYIRRALRKMNAPNMRQLLAGIERAT